MAEYFGTDEADALQIAKVLCKRLDDRSAGIEKAEQYYNGHHNLRFATRKYREAFGALFREFADNYCGLVVDSTAERLRIEGFRLPTEATKRAAEQAAKEAAEAAEQEREAAAALAAQAAAAPTGSGAKPQPSAPPAAAAAKPPKAPNFAAMTREGPLETSGIGIGANTGDDEAWELWQRNNLDLYSDLAHETALVTGYAYIMVGPKDDGSTEEPIITVEHPLEVITQCSPEDPRTVTAAIKRWYDPESKHWYLTLYLPESVWRFESTATSKGRAGSTIRWRQRQGGGADYEWVIASPIKGKVPIVQLANRQKLNGEGRSELVDIMPIQDAINKMVNDMLVASEFASFRQRVFIGMEIPEDEKGNIIPDFDLKAAIDRIMVVKDENVKAFEFGITDLSQYVKGVEHLRNDIAAITRTPPQYLVGEIVNSSSEALKAAESGLVKKVQKKSRFFGEGWEEAIRLAFALKGDKERAESFAAETIWANPEVMTEAALADSLAKYMILGVPMVALWEKLGATQTEIDRWLQLKREEPAEPIGWPAALGSLVRSGEKDVE